MRIPIGPLIAVAVIVAACAGPTPEPIPVPTAGASPLPTLAGSPAPNATASPIVAIPWPAPDACPLEQLPGPADVPPYGSSEMDFSDLGPGRWRFCTDGVVVEASAWCEWDPQRTQILEISGLPERDARLTYDAWIRFEEGIHPIRSIGWRIGAHVEVGVTYLDRGGSLASYVGPPDIHASTVDAGGLGGVLAFSVALQADPESGPMADVPVGYDGVIRWRCGDPPPA